MEASAQPPEFEILVSPELEGGVYANFLTIWHTPFEFTLDFCATLQPRLDDQDAPIVFPCRLVSRVKLPPMLVFDVLQALNQRMSIYEQQFGEIRRPGDNRT